MTTETITPHYRTIRGKRMVLLAEAQFDELVRKADMAKPTPPAADADGCRPADAYAAFSVARDILNARRKLGLSQADLARRAGIRAETLNRIEHGRNNPSVPTITKIDRALAAAERETTT